LTTSHNLIEQHRFELLVNAISNYAIYMLDAGGHVVSWNSGAQRFKGYQPAEILGRHFSLFYTPEDRITGEPDKALAKAATTGRFEQEGWRLRKDGQRFWAAVVVNPIRDPVSGELIGYAKVTRDITDRQKAQEELEHARAALFQSQKMEALGQLTGGVAHDFNNFLTVIVNNLGLIQSYTQDPRILKLVTIAQRAADRGARLTQQLLAFARRQPLRPMRQDINTLIREFEALMRRACGANIVLRFDLQAADATAEIDGPQFEGALLNLVVNACDAMPEGGTLTIHTSRVEIGAPRVAHMPAGTYLQVTVEDDGTGMSPEVQRRAFEPFYTTKDVGKGTGLGLSQVEGFVSQSGGFVDLQSTPGTGTRISILLPICQAGNAAEAGVPDAPPRSGTVLVVEDDPDVMEVAVAIFHGLGFRVLTAGNATDALEILKSDAGMTLMFSDVVMPNGLNGVQLAQQARLLRPELPVILASGYPQRVLAEDIAGLSQFHFITKPYRWTEVADKVRSALDHRD
jgi:PAS domain S-box-containing protein